MINPRYGSNIFLMANRIYSTVYLSNSKDFIFSNSTKNKNLFCSICQPLLSCFCWVTKPAGSDLVSLVVTWSDNPDCLPVEYLISSSLSFKHFLLISNQHAVKQFYYICNNSSNCSLLLIRESSNSNKLARCHILFRKALSPIVQGESELSDNYCGLDIRTRLLKMTGLRQLFRTNYFK